MNINYFPFTCLPEPTAQLLADLVGPVAVYQPIGKNVSDALNQLASRGLVHVRIPMTHDDDRLCAALAEFTEWARLNPRNSTAGMDFVGVRQGQVPFYEETSIHRIRSEFRKYDHLQRPEDESNDSFGARLFLALSQENDRAMDGLDQDLDQIEMMEKAFLEDFDGADEAGFNRQAYGGTMWREDPGARMTGQRLRAWARLAADDDQLPEVLVTTSPAVIDNLQEHAGSLVQLASFRPGLPNEAGGPLLGRVLAGLADGSISLDTASVMAALPADDSDANVCVSLYALSDQPPTTFIQGLVPGVPIRTNKVRTGHTLIVLIEG
ncbi:MAG: hypothetical protein CR984_03350 [Proteobacteria bacterium]|nr:MAG: hypothetical protein CR984_03350 [Pseudomonadota bacterium]